MAEPELPTAEDVAKLPRWARVAFAARCARRLLPRARELPCFRKLPFSHSRLYIDNLPNYAGEMRAFIKAVELYAAKGIDRIAQYRAEEEHASAVVRESPAVIKEAEAAFDRADIAAAQAFAAAGRTHFGVDTRTHSAFATARELEAVAEALREVRDAARSDYAIACRGVEVPAILNAIDSARYVAHELTNAAPRTPHEALGQLVGDCLRKVADFDAAEVARLTVAAVPAARPAVLADFQTLVIAAREGKWTDDTPVPPTAFPPAVFEPGDDPAAFPPWQEAFEAIRASEPPPALAQERQDADAAMRRQYPGEYVAYALTGSTAPREILAHDPSLKVVRGALAHLTDAEMDAVRVVYCDAPAPAFRGGPDGRQRPDVSNKLPRE